MFSFFTKKKENQSRTDEEHQDEERKEYLEQRKHRIDLLHDVSKSFDQAIITLAGGALGLSITFIRRIAPQPDLSTLLTLIASWAFLVGALLSVLSSLFTSQIGMMKAIEEIDNIYNDQDVPSLPKNVGIRLGVKTGSWFNTIFGWRPLTSILNSLAIVFTITGIALLAWFSIQNSVHILPVIPAVPKK